MRNGSAIPIWFSDENRERVEEAAALAGYRHISTYIRDRALGRSRTHAGIDSVTAWADREELVVQLGEVVSNQRQTQAILTMALYLLAKKANSSEMKELQLICEHAGTLTNLLPAVLPGLAPMLANLIDTP